MSNGNFFVFSIRKFLSSQAIVLDVVDSFKIEDCSELDNQKQNGGLKVEEVSDSKSEKNGSYNT